MLSWGVRGDNLSMKSIRSNGLAGATRLNLAKPHLEGLRKGVVRDLVTRGAGDCAFEPRRARDLLKDGTVSDDLRVGRKCAMVGESFVSSDPSLSSASRSIGLVKRFNLLLVLVSLLARP